MMNTIRSKIMQSIFGGALVASLLIGLLGNIITSFIINYNSAENMNLLCENNANQVNALFERAEESISALANYLLSEENQDKTLKDDNFRASMSETLQKNALHHIENLPGVVAMYIQYNSDYIGKSDGFYYAKSNDSDSFHLISLSTSNLSNENNNIHIPSIYDSTTWAESYYDSKLDSHIISYIIPVYRNEILIARIGLNISTDYIEKIVKNISVYKTGHGALLKNDGTVIYHPNFETNTIIGEGDPDFEGVIEKLNDNNNDAKDKLISYKISGVQKKLSSYKLRNGMFLVCSAPSSEIFHHQIVFTIINIIIVIGVVILSIFSSYLLSNKLVKPIKNLNDAATHMVNGEFDYEIEPATFDEIGELTNTFIETRKVLKQQIDILENEAFRDGLTGVRNKSAFMQKEAEINKAIKEGQIDFTVIAFDLNMLKVANDVFGHMAGDKLLSTFAKHLADIFGAPNVYRLGGDEFAAIIYEDGKIDSAKLISSCIEQTKTLSVDGFPECKISCAHGCARLDKMLDHQFSDVLRKADKEMYINKAETKKEVYPWQFGSKGIKQLQIEKYAEILKSFNASSNDYLFLINIEDETIRFFGGNNSIFSLSNLVQSENNISAMLENVFENDRETVKNALHSVINHQIETIDIAFRMRIDNDEAMQWVSCRGNVIKDNTNHNFVFIGKISQDEFTRLYNKTTTLFNKRKLEINLRENSLPPFSCLMLFDIDNFSEINTRNGHSYVDTLLKDIAAKLEEMFDMWQIYHTEIDRFTILLDVSSRMDAKQIFDQIREFSNDFVLSGSIVPNDNSMYSSFENIYDYAVDLISNSENNKDGTLTFFSKDDILKKIMEVELLEDIEQSIKNNFDGFYFDFQPQINAKDFSIISAEVLLRFKSKTQGETYPNNFIPLLEKTGLIHEVGLWVVDEALSICKKWREFNPDFKISVNISSKQFNKKSFAFKIINLLSKHNLPGDALILEITESLQFENYTEVQSILSRLHQEGILIAIDDFGIGYSNLGKLKYLHANIVKIDRLFIKEIKENTYNYNLIHHIINFAKSNDLKVCIEGIETIDEFEVIFKLNADYYQGFLFEHPCNAEFLQDKYFNTRSQNYIEREKQLDVLNNVKKHSPIFQVEMNEILNGIDVGLWIIRTNNKTGKCELYANKVMRKLLGLNNDISPEECYTHWYNNIFPKYHGAVESMINEMTTSQKVMQVEYHWNHPQAGDILVRCSGRCSKKDDEYTLFEGFHRIIDPNKSF